MTSNYYYYNHYYYYYYDHYYYYYYNHYYYYYYNHHQFAAIIQDNLHYPAPPVPPATKGFCWSKVLLPACPYWGQLAHVD